MAGVPDPTTVSLSDRLSAALPTVTTYTGGYQASIARQTPITPGVVRAPAQSPASRFFSFAGSVANSVGNLAWDFGKQVASIITTPLHLGQALSHSYDVQAALNSNMEDLQAINSLYRQGKLSQKAYLNSLHQWQISAAKLNQQSKDSGDQLSHAATSFYQQYPVDVLSLITLGAGGPALAGVREAFGPVAGALGEGGAWSQRLLATGKVIDGVMGRVVEGANSVMTWGGKFNPADAKVAQAIQEGLPEQAVNEIKAMTGNTMRLLGPDATNAQLMKHAAYTLLVTRPVTYQLISGTGISIYQDMASGKYGDAAVNVGLLATALLSGGPIGAALRYGGKIAGTATGSIFERPAFLDYFSQQFGNGEKDAGARYLQSQLEKDPQRGGEVIRLFNNMAETQTKSKGSVINGVHSAIDWFDANGLDRSKMTTGEAIDSMVSWARHMDALEAAASAGKLGADAASAVRQGRAVLSRMSVQEKNSLINVLRQADATAPGDFDGKVFARQKAIGGLNTQLGGNIPWMNSKTMMSKISQIVSNTGDTEQMVKQIYNIKVGNEVAGIPKDLAEAMSKDGFFVNALKKEAASPYVQTPEGAKLLTSAKNVAPDFFSKVQTRIPVLSHVGDFLTRMGLSPYNSQEAVQTLFQRNLRENLADMTLGDVNAAVGGHQADAWLNQLSDASKRMAFPANDLRQLPVGVIKDTLGVSRGKANEIADAINQSMLQVPLQLRGLGDRLVDWVSKVRVAGVNPEQTILRAQGRLRFAWNPFFQTRVAGKVEYLSQLAAKGKPLSLPGWNAVRATIFPGQEVALQSTVGLLEREGIFGVGGYADLATDDYAAGVFNRLGKSPKLSVAGLVNTLAKRADITPEELVANQRNEVIDLVSGIVHYPHTGEFINSPMVRFLNTVFFPSRFGAKVAGLTAKFLSQQSPLVQVGLIHGFLQAQSWLRSDEGLAWKARNADAVQLFSYFSPTTELASVWRVLSGHANTIGDIGQMGGLPFGWIANVLEAEGIIHLNAPYVTPDGQQIPDYIPSTSKGAAQAALMGFLGSIFSYPGATIGLPSKTKLEENTIGTFTGATTKTDFNQVNRPLSPEQQHQQQVEQQATGSSQPAPQHFDGPAIPTEFKGYGTVQQTPTGLQSVKDAFMPTPNVKTPKAKKAKKPNIVKPPKIVAPPPKA